MEIIKVPGADIAIARNAIPDGLCKALTGYTELLIDSGLTKIGTLTSDGTPVTRWDARNVYLNTLKGDANVRHYNELNEFADTAILACISALGGLAGAYIGMPLNIVHRWTNGDYLADHTDSFEGEEGDTGIKYGVICYLNSGSSYSGGSLYYPDLDLELEAESGMIVVHSSDIRHGVLPVINGVRYSMTGFQYDAANAPSYI